VPDKQTIYPEHLPDWLREHGQPNTKREQFSAYLRSHSKAPVLDLREPLHDAKEQGPLYFFTDTHWNAQGAFIGYQALIRKLSEQMPGLEPLSQEMFVWQRASDSKGMDLARLLGQEEQIREKALVDVEIRPPLQVFPLTALATTRLDKQWAPKTEAVLTVNPNRIGKLIIFRDSFSGYWVNFLSQHFREVIYLWQYNWDKEFLEREQPDVVVDEITERLFNLCDPEKLLLEDNLATGSPAMVSNDDVRRSGGTKQIGSQNSCSLD
jgi:hypothetical protein